MNEDLRKWFKQKWVRMDTKGNIKGDCAREPGEGKPKCLPQDKAHALGKEGRAKAAIRKRREDPNPDRHGAPINVRTEESERIDEKNVPTSPEKWARAKAQAKAKFAVYPSAYANGWASKKYKAMGGGWKSISEELTTETEKPLQKAIDKINGKIKKETVMGKLANGDDPMEPWSRKNNAPLEERSEQQLLVAYIRSLGYAPEFMTSSQKSAYARSKGFAQYKVSHDFTAKNEAYIKKTAAQKIAAALQKERDKNKRYSDSNERIRQLDALKKGMKTEEEEINEAGTGLLMTFIRAKGLDPLTMHGNQKASYSRSSEFRIFKRKHRQVKETSGMGERGEDWNEASSPAQQAAIAVNMKKKGIKPKDIKEEADKKDTVMLDIPLLIRVLELAREDIKTDMDLHRVVERLIDIRTKGMLTMADYNFIAGLKEEFQIDELKKLPDNMDAETIGVAREDSVCWPGYKRKSGTKKFTPGSCVKEDKYQDPHAATQTVGMEVEGKSRAFKAVKKLTKMNETLYDWEKTEKDNGTKKKEMTAKIVMKGGKTMTGQERDTIQIDPIVKTKLDQYKSVNSNNNK